MPCQQCSNLNCMSAIPSGVHRYFFIIVVAVRNSLEPTINYSIWQAKWWSIRQSDDHTTNYPTSSRSRNLVTFFNALLFRPLRVAHQSIACDLSEKSEIRDLVNLFRMGDVWCKMPCPQRTQVWQRKWLFSHCCCCCCVSLELHWACIHLHLLVRAWGNEVWVEWIYNSCRDVLTWYKPTPRRFWILFLSFSEGTVVSTRMELVCPSMFPLSFRWASRLIKTSRE